MVQHSAIDHTGITGVGGSVATDTIWDAAGDLVQGTGANTAAKLGAGTAAMFLKSAGAAAANLWAFPPGHELDYVQKTTDTSVTATTEAGADTVVTGNAVTYDGSTIVMIEFYAALANPSGSASLVFILADGGTAIGEFGTINQATGIYMPLYARRRLTPSAASHTYSVEAYTGSGTATVYAGAGGAGAKMPTFIRISKV